MALRVTPTAPHPLQKNAGDVVNPRRENRIFSTSGQGESRTHDTRIFSPLLYYLSYLS
jgi:hypothetical protein